MSCFNTWNFLPFGWTCKWKKNFFLAVPSIQGLYKPSIIKTIGKQTFLYFKQNSSTCIWQNFIRFASSLIWKQIYKKHGKDEMRLWRVEPATPSTVAQWANPYVRLDGQKIGIIGYITPVTKDVSNSEDMIFLDEIEAVTKVLQYSHGGKKPVTLSLNTCPEAGARFFKAFKEPRNRFPAWRAGTRQPYLSYRHARLHRLSKSIPGLLKRLQIRALLWKRVGADVIMPPTSPPPCFPAHPWIFH